MPRSLTKCTPQEELSGPAAKEKAKAGSQQVEHTKGEDLVPFLSSPPVNEDVADRRDFQEFTQLKAVEDVAETYYRRCHRAMGILATPNCGVPLDSDRHRDPSKKDHEQAKVTLYERVLACRRVVQLVVSLYVAALEGPKNDSLPFPGMHRDISQANIMVTPATQIPWVDGFVELDEIAVPLIDRF